MRASTARYILRIGDGTGDSKHSTAVDGHRKHSGHFLYMLSLSLASTAWMRGEIMSKKFAPKDC